MDITSDKLVRLHEHKKTCIWLRKGDLKREIESFPIAARNNTIRINFIKAKIDNTQLDSQCRLRSKMLHTKNKGITILRYEDIICFCFFPFITK